MSTTASSPSASPSSSCSARSPSSRSPAAPTSAAPARSATRPSDATPPHAPPRPGRGRRPHRRRGRGRGRASPAPAPRSCRSRPTPARAVDPARPRGDRRQPPPVLQPRHHLADGAGIGTFSAADFVAFLWPTADRWLRRQGADRPLRRHHRRASAPGSGFFYAPEARAWITAYPADALPKAEAVYRAGPARRHAARARSPSTRSARTSAAESRSASASQWFECGCHGSQYNQVGEKKGGPAPRGMDHFPLDSSAARRRHRRHRHRRRTARPIGTNTTGQEAEGPHCVGSR